MKKKSHKDTAHNDHEPLTAKDKWTLGIFIALILILILAMFFGHRLNLGNKETTKSSIDSTEELNQVFKELTKQNFDDLPFAEKIDLVNKGGFSSCNEIRSFCSENPFILSCKEYCGRYYYGWYADINATVETDGNSYEFVTKLNKESFSKFDLETQKEIIEFEKFSSCNQVLDYCLNVESTDGCKKYCGKYLLEPVIIADRYNTEEKIIIN